MLSDQIFEFLCQRRYCGPEWFALPEVPPTKGALNHLDMVAWNLFSSRGLTVHGIEIKASRSDWLRELKSPQKSEHTHAMVESFYVAAPQGVVRLEEVPPEWGFMEIRGDRLFTPKKAPFKKRGHYDLAELAGILRRIMSTWTDPATGEVLKRAKIEAYRIARDHLAEERDRCHKDRDDAVRELSALREQIGIRGWTGDIEKAKKIEHFRKVVALLEDDAAPARIAERIEAARSQLRHVDHELAKIQAGMAVPPRSGTEVTHK